MSELQDIKSTDSTQANLVTILTKFNQFKICSHDPACFIVKSLIEEVKTLKALLAEAKKELSARELLEKMGCEFFPGSKFLQKDKGNGEIYEAVVDHIEFHATVKDKLEKSNGVDFCMVYYRFRYCGKYDNLAWSSDNTIRKNQEIYKQEIINKARGYE